VIGWILRSRNEAFCLQTANRSGHGAAGQKDPFPYLVYGLGTFVQQHLEHAEVAVAEAPFLDIPARNFQDRLACLP
jgi:hypothetical protein